MRPPPSDGRRKKKPVALLLAYVGGKYKGNTHNAHTPRGSTVDDVVEVESGSTLADRARQRARGLDLTLLLADASAPGDDVRLLTSFAAFDRSIATWKTRLAAMQCKSTSGRVALAQRALRWTIARLDAECSLRSAFFAGSF